MITLRVFHFNRVSGCDPRIIAFFGWWNVHGPYSLTVPELGGMRSDALAQLNLWRQGRETPGPHAGEPGYPPLGQIVTNAKTLFDTPHGRGKAADAYPAILDPTGTFVVGIKSNDKDPQTLLQFAQYGALAEAHGLEWGGRWAKPDRPHVQCKNWRDPSPPPNGAP